MARSKSEGDPGGASAEAFSEGPQLVPLSNTSTFDPLCDQDGDEDSDTPMKTAFSDTVG